MAGTPDFVECACERLAGAGAVRRGEIFGDYMVYIQAAANQARRLNESENRYDKESRSVSEAIRQLMAPPDSSHNPLGFTAKIRSKDQTS